MGGRCSLTKAGRSKAGRTDWLPVSAAQLKRPGRATVPDDLPPPGRRLRRMPSQTCFVTRHTIQTGFRRGHGVLIQASRAPQNIRLCGGLALDYLSRPVRLEQKNALSLDNDSNMVAG